MNNILSFGVSLPSFRIDEKVLSPQHGRKGNRAVIFSDEDILTLGFSAANDCLNSYEKQYGSQSKVDAVLYATTTPIFSNRYHASFVADLLELPTGILAQDFTASPKSGSDALILANQLIVSGAYHNILIVAADTYFPPVGEEMATPFGHAGCAVLVSDGEGVAEIKSTGTYSSAIAEEFTYKNKPVQLDARFGRDAGFKSSISSSLKRFLEESILAPADYKSIILNSKYARAALGLFKKTGFDTDNGLYRDSLQSQVGFTGACHALLLLTDCLTNITGDILFIDYFNGTNILHIEANEGISGTDYIPSLLVKNTKIIETYQDYLALESAGNAASLRSQPQEIFSSDMMAEREKGSLLHLKGYECQECKTVYFIEASRCSNCGHGEFKRRKLSKSGSIFTFTQEHYFPTAFPPVTMAVVDLDGGGRMTLQLTDEMRLIVKDDSLMGARVELVLRKMIENDSKPNYFWKCRLVG